MQQRPADVRSSEDSVPLDWNAVRAHLAAHGLRLAHDPPPRQFAGGLANLNYLIDLDGKPAVLRRPPLGELPAGAYDMAREYRILSRLPDALAFVPRALRQASKPFAPLEPVSPFFVPLLSSRLDYRPVSDNTIPRSRLSTG